MYKLLSLSKPLHALLYISGMLSCQYLASDPFMRCLCHLYQTFPFLCLNIFLLFPHFFSLHITISSSFWPLSFFHCPVSSSSSHLLLFPSPLLPFHSPYISLSLFLQFSFYLPNSCWRWKLGFLTCHSLSYNPDLLRFLWVAPCDYLL